MISWFSKTNERKKGKIIDYPNLKNNIDKLKLYNNSDDIFDYVINLFDEYDLFLRDNYKSAKLVSDNLKNTFGDYLKDCLSNIKMIEGSNIVLSPSHDNTYYLLKELNNDKTRGDGSFDKTFKTINIIKESEIALRIITVLSKNNYDEIPELATTIHEKLGLGFRLLPNIIEYGKGVEANDEHGISYPRIKELMDNFYYDFLRKHINDTNLTVELNMAIIPIDIYRHSFCPWGKAMLGIGYSGNIALCHVAADNDMFIFDNVKKTKVSDVWNNNEKLKKFKSINPDELKGVCGNCLARSLCRGGCRLHAMTKYFGDFYAPDPECQNVYDINYFPEYALEDESKDGSYQNKAKK